MSINRQHFIFIGPLLAIALYFLLEVLGVESKPSIAASITLLTVIWWITETVNIAVTALLPLILFPLLKVMEIAEVGANYGSPIIFLFRFLYNQT